VLRQDLREPSTPIPNVPQSARLRPSVEVVYPVTVPPWPSWAGVDRAKATEVSGTVGDLLAVGVNELVVDLTHAWDSAALLTVLARTRADLADNGGTLRLVGVALPEFLPR
jgi:hypothetical protein